MTVAVVIPCYKVKGFILGVIERIGAEVSAIYVVDDACPEQSGDFVKNNCRDPRVRVIYQPANSGVGGATIRGLEEAFREDHQIGVKIDGDGQMDPAILPRFTAPIAEGRADYTKGNRFHSPRSLTGMPKARLIGNAGLSFLSKATTGYWNVMDPTNGYFALHLALLPNLEPQKLARRYFFENDLLFRLGLVRAVVLDIPMHASYGEEKSNLSIVHSLTTFPPKFFGRLAKRIFYQYFLRDFHLGSVLLLAGGGLLGGGIAFGLYHWLLSWQSGHVASSGTVMLAALPTMLGFQMVLFTLLFDVLMVPRTPVAGSLADKP